MAIDLDVVTRLNRATAREAAREAQSYFKDAGEGAGDDFGDGFSKGLTSKIPEVEKALKKVQDASGKVLVEQEKLNAMKDKSNVTDTQRIAQSERLAKAHRAEESAIRDVNRAMDEHNAKSDDAVTKTRNLGDEASKAAKKVGDLGVSFKGLGAIGVVGMLPAAATAITEVAGALQQLSGAALAGPGIFAGIAASAGTAALGMHGMSDAFTASIKALDGTKASVEAANKALASLSPNAADAIKTVVGLKGTFTELRDIASENIFQGFSGNLKNLVSADLPGLTRGIDGISKGLNQNLTEVMRSLGSSSSQGFLDRILGNTGDAQSRLTGAIEPIVHAVGVLTAAGSDTLPRLADAVGKVADRFDRFISTADANGNLTKWIDDGLTGFTQLGNTVLNIGKIFTDLTAAAGGGQGLLGTLESATGKLHDFLSSTQGQDQLRQYFTQGRDMLGQLRDIAVQAGPILGGMFQAAASAAKVWLPVIEQILQTINSIPGGAAAVVNAFIAWQAIKGIASVATGLNGIVNVLKFVIPGAAVEGAAGVSAALAGITLPAWMATFIKAGGSLAALPATAMTFATEADKYYQANHPGATNENASSRGKAGMADAIANGGVADPNRISAPGYSGGGGSFGPGPAPGYGASVDPNWTPVLDPKAARPGTYRTRDGQIRDIPGQNAGAPGDPATPGISGYSDPVITSGGGAGTDTPYIDPAKFAVGNPLAGMPAPSANADPQAVYEADSRALTAANNLAQGKLSLAVLEAKGNATQQELLTARNNIQEQERALYDSQFKDLEARQGKMAKASGDLQGIFAPLDQDFGVSGGIPGIVKNLVTFLGNMALGGAIASSPQLQAAAIAMQSEKTGVGATNAANKDALQQSYFGAAGTGAPGGQNPNVNAMFALAQQSSGNTKYAPASDLVNGLADCSGSISDLYEVLTTGQATAARKFTTTNFASDAQAAQLGFLPGFMPGALNVGVNPYPGNSGHMAATLPNGVNFEGGGGTGGGAQYGGPASGALDPQFEKQYYYPVGGPSAMGPAPIGGGIGANPAAAASTSAQQPSAFGGSGFPIPLPVTIVGGIGGPLAGVGGAPPVQGGTGGLPAPAGTPASGIGLGPPPGPAAPVAGAPDSGIGLGAPPGPLPAIPAGAGGEGYMGLGGPPMAPNIGPGPLQPGPFPIPGAGPGAVPPSGNNPFAGPYSAAPSPGMAGLDPNSPIGLGRAPGAVGPFPTPPSVAPAPGVGAPTAAAGTASLSQAASGGGGGGGVGMTPGGSLDSALSAATAAADLFAPGAGQAAQVGIKLANRAIQYGGQAAAIGVSGLMETFLPHNSELGDPGKSWVGKIAGGIAAAKPAGPNQAGKPADPQKQQGNQTEQGQQHNGPMVNIENMHNNGADGQGVGNDIARQQYASYSAAGPR